MNQQKLITPTILVSHPHPDRPAPLLRWLCAMAYDGVLLFCLWLILGVVFIALNPAHALPWWVTQLILWLSSAGYFSYCWSSIRGQTVGALAWKLRVVSTHVQSPYFPRLSTRQALIRFLGAVCSLVFCGIGHVWRLFDPADQTAYDRLSQTRLVYASKSAS